MGNKQHYKYILIAVVLMGLSAALFLGLTQKSPAPQVTFTDLSGNRISMQSLRGKMVLVNFWATDCPGCVEEMPHIVETYKQYRDKGFEVIAVAMSYNPPNYVLQFKQQRGLSFPIVLDVQGDLARQFDDVKLIPTSFLIDRDGNVVERTVGTLDFDKLRDRLDQALLHKG